MSDPPSTPAPPHRLRWYQYSLRSLLILMTLCCILLSVWRTYVPPYRAQQRAFETLKRLNAEIRTEPGGPFWLRWFIDEEPVRVVFVQLEHTNVKDDDLACLEDLPDVERLYLAATAIGDKGLRHVAKLKKLRRLSLWNTNITNDGIGLLSGSKTLEALDIQGTRVTEAALEHLCGLPKLREFPNSIGWHDAALERLSRFACFPDLRIPDVRLVEVTDAGMKTLGQLKSVESFSLYDCRLSPAGLAQLQGVSALKHLYFYSAPKTPQTFPCLARLPQDINFYFNGAYIGLEVLAAAWGPRIQVLQIGPGHIQASGENCSFYVSNVEVPNADLAHLRHFTALRKLWLFGEQFDAGGPHDLGRLHQLEDLSICTPLSDAALQRIAEARNLRKLYISAQGHGYEVNVTVTPQGIENLRRLSRMEELTFWHVRLTNESLAPIGQMTNLKNLGLQAATELEGSGIAHLKGLDKLEYLGLTDCIRVGDDALVHIAALRNLTGISLQFTRVTDDGLRRLYGMPKLARVSLLGSKATPQGRQALLKALPVGVDTY